MTHTPGKWHKEKLKSGWRVWRDDGTKIGEVIARMIRKKADAQIIAAAPDLLDALRDTKQYVQWCLMDSPTHKLKAVAQKSLDKLEAALSKAEGQS